MSFFIRLKIRASQIDSSVENDEIERATNAILRLKRIRFEKLVELTCYLLPGTCLNFLFCPTIIISSEYLYALEYIILYNQRYFDDKVVCTQVYKM